MASPNRNRGDVFPAASKLIEVLLQMYLEYGQEGVEADRECLYCGDTFLSASAHNRRCPECCQLFHDNPDAFAEWEPCRSQV